MTDLAEVVLAPGRDGPARGGHPWVFSGGILRVAGAPEPGDMVRVLDSRRGYVGTGLFNPHSQIRVRLYRWDDGPLDEAFFRSRIAEAVAIRSETLGLGGADGAARLVFSEGDGLSGLVVDRYGRYLTLQLTSLALERRSPWLLDALEELVRPEAIVLRTERGVLEEEGLRLQDSVVRGRAPDGPIEIVEEGLTFAVALETGQKTGFYLDQRINRTRAARYAQGRSVADVCCYSGGFGIAALDGGAASVVGVDVSQSALELAATNARVNGVDDRHTLVRSDAFKWLAEQADTGARYGMIVLDPPRFARSRRGVPEALKAYRRLNGLALECLEPGGILVTCSCSGRVALGDFLGSVGRAAADVGRTVRVLERLGQGPDHPVSATCAETEYLKCLICYVA
jgi:23S rRNA (cytosine1962-C5)-methyltransferase